MSLAEITKLVATSEPINVNQVAYQVTGRLRASPKDPVIGVDILPPMNTIALNFGSVADSSRMKALGLKLPENFSWNNYEDVKKNKADLNLPEDWLTPVYNQGLCGSCWAFSSASCLSDRFAIANNTKSPQFSPSYFLSCDNKKIEGTLGGNQGCSGGIPSSAFQFARDEGIPSIFCQDYDWCMKNKKICYTKDSKGAGAAALNKIIPQCQKSCLTCEEQSDGSTRCKPSESEFKVYKADSWPKNELDNKQVYIAEHTNAAKTFFGDGPKVITEIKEEIWLRGPVVGCYKILQDFVVREKWYKGTSGLIYINDRTKNYKALGYHAVVIMGWGTEELPDKTKLPYWIVKNSWGDQYGDNGYFKYAMYNKEKDINVDTNLDVPIKIDGGYLFCGISAPIVFSKEKVIKKIEEKKEVQKEVSKKEDVEEEQEDQEEDEESFFSKLKHMFTRKNRKNKKNKNRMSLTENDEEDKSDYQNYIKMIILIVIIIAIIYVLLKPKK